MQWNKNVLRRHEPFFFGGGGPVEERNFRVTDIDTNRSAFNLPGESCKASNTVAYMCGADIWTCGSPRIGEST